MVRVLGNGIPPLDARDFHPALISVVLLDHVRVVSTPDPLHGTDREGRALDGGVHLES